MRYFLAFLALFTAVVLSVFGLLGFRGAHFTKPPLYVFPDMEWQLKLRPQKPNGFLPSGLSSQLPVAGTIPRGNPLETVGGSVFPYEDSPVNTGLLTGTTNYLENNPLAINAELLKRGQQRFTINCSPCHGQLADGNGITRKIGAMAVVANLHDKRIVEMPDGELFYIISNGRNLMRPYAPNVTVADRWAVVAYLRALQLSRLGTLDEVPESLRVNLKK